MSTRNDAIALAACLGLLWLFSARADGPVNIPGLAAYAKMTDLTAMQATVMSAMGSEQGAVVPTDAGGNFSVTFLTPFNSASYAAVIDVGKVAGAQPITCNRTPATQTASFLSGTCLQNVIAVNGLLGITISLAPVAPPTGTLVSIIAREKTQ